MTGEVLGREEEGDRVEEGRDESPEEANEEFTMIDKERALVPC